MIEAQVLEHIAETVELSGPGTMAVAALRLSYPDIHFTYCMDDDIHTARPILCRPGFNLYLVDGSQHCLNLTNDLHHASGIVLAEVCDD